MSDIKSGMISLPGDARRVSLFFGGVLVQTIAHLCNVTLQDFEHISGTAEGTRGPGLTSSASQMI